jgi:outer membrane receptor for ferrienterochelin and colicins
VFDAVRGDTGISIQGRTISGRKAINLRGMDSRHTLVLVDGKRIGASDGVIGHSDYQYDWIAVDDIERIEVIRGPMSVLYGAEALGGVVNVITRAPGGERWRRAAHGRRLSRADGQRGGDGHRAVACTPTARWAAGLRWRSACADVRRERSPTAPTRVSATSRAAASATPRCGCTGRRPPATNWSPSTAWATRSAGPTRASAAAPGATTTARPRSTARTARWAGPVDPGGALDWRSQLRAYRSTLAWTTLRNNGVARCGRTRWTTAWSKARLSLAPSRPGQLLSGGFELRRERLDQRRPARRRGPAPTTRRCTCSTSCRAGEGAGADRRPAPRPPQPLRRRVEPARCTLVWQAAPGWTVKGGYGHGFKAPTLKQISPDYKEDEGPYTYCRQRRAEARDQ